jgi:Ni/Co efflux regulator RcnB
MKKLILLALICTGFAVTTPFTAHALDSEKIAQYDRNRNRNDQNRDNQNSDNQDRDNEGRATQSCDRLFIVYYRNYDDRKWIYESKHCNRRDARRAANRLERRGYLIQIL